MSTSTVRERAPADTTPAESTAPDAPPRRWTPFTHLGGRVALVEDGRSVSHADLARSVEDLAARLPDVRTGRRLVHLTPTADLAGVVGYLATLAAGHVALVTDSSAETVTTSFRPDLRIGRAGRLEVLEPTPQHLLHPDLALLLSTSGSTGSPKLVRLSHTNLVTNADAIATSLDLSEHDRAITSLPLHYCYGLSWVHAVLRAGGSLVLTRESVTSDRFWRLVDDSRTSIIAGVPHTFDLIDDRLREDHPGLRLLTQAGGAMTAERVQDLAERGRAKGWQLAVMYGQTEATARMSVLPGSHAAVAPDAVGWAVTDSSFHLDHDVPGGTDEIGELVFTGPGVMLGYAEHPDDLALGRMTTQLRTRDLGRVDPDGLVRVVGRRDAVAKVMGLRIDLDRVEAALADAGYEAVVTADARRLLVAVVSHGPDASAVAGARQIVARTAALPPAGVLVAATNQLPRLSNGKVDRTRSRALVVGSERPAPVSGDRLARVTGIVADALGRDEVDPDRSFSQLGGDSYSVVQTSLHLERILGPLPTAWHRLPLRQLAGAARDQGRHLHWVETPVALRAMAVLAICASHIGLVSWPGGAHALLVLAGWSMARFTLDTPVAAQQRRRGVRSLLTLLVPSMLVALAVRLSGGGYGWANVFLVNWLFGTVERGPRVHFWFVEALLACVVLVLALTAVPALQRRYLRSPWEWSMALAALALVPRWILIPDPTGSISGLPGSVLWLFAIGLALGVATTRRQQLAALALTVIGMVGFFTDPTRGATVAAAVVVLALVPRVPLPRLLVPVTGLLAAASLHIYLVQFQVFPHVDHGLLALALSVTAGVLAWALLHPPTRALTDFIAPSSPRPRPPENPPHAPTRRPHHRPDLHRPGPDGLRRVQ